MSSHYEVCVGVCVSVYCVCETHPNPSDHRNPPVSLPLDCWWSAGLRKAPAAADRRTAVIRLG